MFLGYVQFGFTLLYHSPKNAKMTKNTKNSIKIKTEKTERTKMSDFFELG